MKPLRRTKTGATKAAVRRLCRALGITVVDCPTFNKPGTTKAVATIAN